MTHTDPAAPTFDDLLTALRGSHERLVTALTPLSRELTTLSYCDDWTIAQVASHLGSGAEIFALFLEAGLRGEPAPAPERFRAIWDRWNAKRPEDQARDALAGDQVGAWQLDMFGAERRLPDLLRMRLSEHALHTWDVVVALDPQAALAADAVALLIDTVPGLAERVGRAASGHAHVRVTTTDPGREFVLELTHTGVRLAPAAAGAEDAPEASLRLPAEALLRLVSGRLDASHTPSSVVAQGVDLDVLRGAFPGF
jgi:uncharacterized protein (TIGR03083 family)